MSKKKRKQITVCQFYNQRMVYELKKEGFTLLYRQMMIYVARAIVKNHSKQWRFHPHWNVSYLLGSYT